MTQGELAEKCGISMTTIARIETNVHSPKLETLVLIARALGTTTDELLGLGEAQKEPVEQNPIQTEPSHPTAVFDPNSLKQLIRETIQFEMAKKSGSPEQPVVTHFDLGDLNEVEIQIIRRLRELPPNYTSSVVKILSPSKTFSNVSTPIVPKTIINTTRKRAK